RTVPCAYGICRDLVPKCFEPVVASRPFQEVAMRFSFARTGVFWLGPWMGSMALAQGVDHQIVYVAELPGVTGTGALCDPWKSPSKTGGIKEALDLCNSGANLGKGCTIVLPRGYVRIEATIDTYNAPSLRGG